MNKDFVEKTVFYETLIHRILLYRNFRSFIFKCKKLNLTEKFYVAKFMLSFSRILHFKECFYIYICEFAHLCHTCIFVCFISSYVKTWPVFLQRDCFVYMFFFFPVYS